MVLKVYDHNESVCCQKVRFALDEKGVPHERVLVDFSTGEQFSAWFRAINPKSVVPVLIDDGHIITESSVINEYIDEAFDGPPLMPDEPLARARKRYWSRQIDHLHMPHIATISFAIAFRHSLLSAMQTEASRQQYLAQLRDPMSAYMQREIFDQGIDAPIFTDAIIEFDRLLTDMEENLQNSPWLAGDQFSLADIDVAPYIWRLSTLQLSAMWAQRPAVTDWCNRVWGRDSWQRTVVSQHLPEWMDNMRDHGIAAQAAVIDIIAKHQD